MGTKNRITPIQRDCLQQRCYTHVLEMTYDCVIIFYNIFF